MVFKIESKGIERMKAVTILTYMKAAHLFDDVMAEISSGQCPFEYKHLKLPEERDMLHTSFVIFVYFVTCLEGGMAFKTGGSDDFLYPDISCLTARKAEAAGLAPSHRTLEMVY